MLHIHLTEGVSTHDGLFYNAHFSFLFFIDFSPPTGNIFVIDIYDIHFIHRGL